ncbi:MAG: hypothetical protein ACRDTC_00375 [Pseudonocardiaceae bacterium]
MSPTLKHPAHVEHCQAIFDESTTATLSTTRSTRSVSGYAGATVAELTTVANLARDPLSSRSALPELNG